MKASATHHDGSDLYSNQGEYFDQDTTVAFDMESAQELHEALGDILAVNTPQLEVDKRGA